MIGSSICKRANEKRWSVCTRVTSLVDLSYPVCCLCTRVTRMVFGLNSYAPRSTCAPFRNLRSKIFARSKRTTSKLSADSWDRHSSTMSC